MMERETKDLCGGLTCFYGFKHHYRVKCVEKLDAGNKMQISADKYSNAANSLCDRLGPRAAGWGGK